MRAADAAGSSAATGFASKAVATSNPAEQTPDVIVIGGGVAGIAAALDCANAGARVTLVEVRRRLGGAAYSFERDGMQIDNGQHVFLRCCAAYRGLLSRLGSERCVRVQERLEIPVLSPGRETVTLSRSGLPAPAHLAGTLMRYRHLTRAQRLRAIRAVSALKGVDPDDETLERQTFGQWLAEHGQDEETVAVLWELIVLATLNVPAAQASPGLAAFVFQQGLLAHADAGDVGFHERPLSETIAEPAARALERAGVRVLLGWRAQRIQHGDVGLVVSRTAGGGVGAGAGPEGAGGGAAPGAAGWDLVDPTRGEDSGQMPTDLESIATRAVIVALPHARAAGMMDDLAPELASRVRQIESSPIVNVHVVYDRQVCEHRFAAGVRTPVQYLFDRTAAAGIASARRGIASGSGGVPEGCQYLAVSLSGAEQEMQMSVDQLRERYLPAMRELFPRARHARVEAFFATREHAATFRASPGVARLRPPVRTPAKGLVLAGTWTDTGWPATLEGATLSGHAAAREALQAL